MDNVEDFFDSDSERSAALSPSGSRAPQTPSALEVLRGAAQYGAAPMPPATPQQAKEQVYHRTPRFSKTPGASRRRDHSSAEESPLLGKKVQDLSAVAAMKTPVKRNRFSSSVQTPGDASGALSVTSDVDFPPPALPLALSEPEEINLGAPPMSPLFSVGAHSLSHIQIDLQGLEETLAPVQEFSAPRTPSSPQESKKKKMRYSRAPPQLFSDPISAEEGDGAPSIVLPRRSISQNSALADDEASLVHSHESSLDRSFSQLPPATPNTPKRSASIASEEEEEEILRSEPSPRAAAPKSTPKKAVVPKKKVKKTAKQLSVSSNKENVSQSSIRRAFAVAPASPFSATLLSSAIDSPMSKLDPDSFFSEFESDSDRTESHRDEISEVIEQAIINGEEPDGDMDMSMSMADSPTSRSVCYDKSFDLPTPPEQEDFEIGEGLNLSELDGLRVEQIKRLMHHFKLPVYGRKTEMIARLRRHFQDRRAGRKRVDSLAPSPIRSRRSSLVDGDDEDTVGQKRKKRITRTKPLEYWNNERVQYSRQKRPSGDFATVVDLIREPEPSKGCLPPSKRRKYNEEEFPEVRVFSTAQEKDVPFCK